MPVAVRARMESALGADFSDVRVHTGSARAVRLRALAFTQGSDIHVAPGQWAPDTSRGRLLLGHELGHVLQQRSGAVRATTQLAGSGLNTEPAWESQADALGRRATADGAPATSVPHAGTVSSGGTVQRQPVAPPAAGSAVERVLDALGVVSPIAGVGDFPAAFAVLDGLPMDELLGTLTDLERRSQLDLLIGNAGSAASAADAARIVTAMRVVRLSHGAGADPRAADTAAGASGLPPGDQLAMRNYLVPLRPPIPTTRGADQRVSPPGRAAALPSADLARELGYELDPSSRPAPAAPVPVRRGAPRPPAPAPAPRIPWDGTTGALGAAAARATMQAELFVAFDEYLKYERPETVAAAGLPRVPFSTPPAAVGGAAPAPTGVVDIANQARAALETRYATTIEAAATSPAQVQARGPFQTTGPDKNLFDPSSEADRTTFTGDPDLARGVAWWLFENDVPGSAGAAGSRRFAKEILDAHHYSTDDPGAEDFRWEVADAYAAASTLPPSNKRQLIDYRMTGWSESGKTGITLQSSYAPGADARRAELTQRWTIFRTATHESLHLRAHPAFVDAQQSRGTMIEGFVEMFTISTLNTDVLPRARAGDAEPLRRTVEGASSPPKPDATLIVNAVTPAQYALHRAQAERIRDGGTPPGGSPHAGVGEAGVRAAFFQGHVEFLGLARTGPQLATLPVAGAPVRTWIPAGIAGLDDLARRSGVPRPAIVRDNPGITDALPPTAVLAGCREHWVVAGETRAMIAAQHGVAQADLVRANPGIALDPANAWPPLTAGQKILIPVH
ncbi:eCIS core domain-containing protein [Actinoplanes sp. CA-051413]|uniref:eCIS core domain-containing protein n=1 Tax=Actinoplanes sp. CA-051413 TaxID=3239899 RepID=UPI003D973A70